MLDLYVLICSGAWLSSKLCNAFAMVCCYVNSSLIHCLHTALYIHLLFGIFGIGKIICSAYLIE